jgi:hypothetical protein
MPAEHIEGADRLHAVLVAMLSAVGQRKAAPSLPVAHSDHPPH